MAGKSRQVLMSAAALGMAGAAAGILESRYERNHFVTDEVRIYSKKLCRPYTLVFVADLHDKEFGPENGELLHSVRRAAPDAVLIGGDSMVAKPGAADLAATGRLLKNLSGLCPVCYGNGNHEQRLWYRRSVYGTLYQDFCRLLHRYGVVYLSDASFILNDEIRVSGFNISRRFYRKFVPPYMPIHDIHTRLGAADPDRFQILLAHSPLFFDAYAAWGADLTLAGHFHGGTIRLPFLGGVMTPQYHFFQPYCAGMFEKGGRRMVVSRGLGTHSINIRIFNRPQLIVLKLFPEEKNFRRTLPGKGEAVYGDFV